MDFWGQKLEANKQRDRKNEELLRKLGWRVLVVWECQMKDIDTVSAIVKEFLTSQGVDQYDEVG